uniref:Ig-like domain-containing protein n=1 Tax=Terrapene triunguis TaxID=2587831 RepID=A0A674JX95_9SAUR
GLWDLGENLCQGATGSARAWERPSISLSPTGVTAPGADVTIRCQGQRRDMRFFLHKTGDLNPQRHMDPAGARAEFRIPSVSRQHGGSYSCSYRPRSEPFVSSQPSDTVELVVAGEGPSSPGAAPAPTRPGSAGPGTGAGGNLLSHRLWGSFPCGCPGGGMEMFSGAVTDLGGERSLLLRHKPAANGAAGGFLWGQLGPSVAMGGGGGGGGGGPARGEWGQGGRGWSSLRSSQEQPAWEAGYRARWAHWPQPVWP